jgi:OCT family organic cation transporter-like MFS transporter 4/5
MHFDDILAGDVGEFGAFQKKIYFLLCLPSISSGFHMVISVSRLETPKHR